MLNKYRDTKFMITEEQSQNQKHPIFTENKELKNSEKRLTLFGFS